jgi:hypothetical protein
MSEQLHLSLEQQFNIKSFENEVKGLNREQAVEFLVKLYEQMLRKENMYREFLKYQWGIETTSWPGQNL